MFLDQNGLSVLRYIWATIFLQLQRPSINWDHFISRNKTNKIDCDIGLNLLVYFPILSRNLVSKQTFSHDCDLFKVTSRSFKWQKHDKIMSRSSTTLCDNFQYFLYKETPFLLNTDYILSVFHKCYQLGVG